MVQADFLIVGGGLAGATGAETLRQQGAGGSIVLACAEPHLPYHRPPLSKGLPLGYEQVENIFVHNEDFYAEHNIDVRLSTRITGVDGRRNLATDAAGNEYQFGKLLVATGSALRQLPVPGTELRNVFYLRTLDDALAIIEAMKQAERAVVIGAGFIGMELTSAFVQNGVHTTMLVREDKLFSKLYSDDLSRFFEDYYKEKGVEIIFRDEAERLEGEQRVEKVITKGGRELDCQMASIGIGVIPEVDFLKDAGVELQNGVVVDEYLRSAHPDIFAAGDVANYYDPVFGKRRRVEHWDNAIKQGGLAAENMLGRERPYNMVSYFFSDLFGLSWEFLGDNMDIDETIRRGSFEEQSAILFYLKENVLKAAFLLMQTPKERQQVEQWILNRTDLAALKQKLADPTTDLGRITA